MKMELGSRRCCHQGFGQGQRRLRVWARLERRSEQGNVRRCRWSVETDVFEIQRIIVDAAQRWSNPVCEFSRLGHTAGHEGLHELIVLRAWQPFEFVFLPCLFGKHFAVDADEVSRKVSNLTMKSLVRQGQAERDSGLIDDRS